MNYHAPKAGLDSYKEGMKIEYFTTVEPGENLRTVIVQRIHVQAKHQALIRLVGYSCMCVASIVALIPAGIWLYADVLHSGFIDSFSLIFTDSSFVIMYWHDFGLLLLESLPALSFATCLIMLVSIIISLKMLLMYGHSVKQFAS